MRANLLFLFALLRGKASGLNRATFGGVEYIIAPMIAGAQDPPAPKLDDETEANIDRALDRIADEESTEDENADALDDLDDDMTPAEAKLVNEVLPDFKGEFDEERAKRAIVAERAKREKRERTLRKRAERAERERDQLRQAQESEQQRIERERDEARQQAETAAKRAQGLLIEKSLSDAALAAGVAPNRLAKLLKVVDTTDIEIEDNGEVVGAAAAVEAELADDDGYFVPKAKEPPADPEPNPEPSGGNPDRKRKPKPMTSEEVAKLARDDPEKFNEMFEANLIPKSALGG